MDRSASLNIAETINRQECRTDISIIIPIFNEESSLCVLYAKIKDTLSDFTGKAEIIFINDGSTDSSGKMLQQIADSDNSVKVFGLGSNKGQCKALEKGFREARGDVIVTLDADLQNDPDDIPRLIERLNDGFDVVCGWRYCRIDPWHKVLKSRVGNYIQRRMTKVKVHDMSCTMRAYRRHVVRDIAFKDKYGISLIPLMLSKRTDKITEVKISHRNRIFGKSKYSFFSTCLGTIPSYLKMIKDRRE